MKPYARTLFRRRLLQLKRACPECGSEMMATGRMHYLEAADAWFVEYLCPREQETLTIRSAETDTLARELARREDGS
jgi:hypothetical protein